MKRLLLLVAGLVVLMSVSAMAQGVGAIMIYTDAGGTRCDANPVGFFQVWVYHEFQVGGVTGSQFQIDPTGTGLTHFGDQNPEPGVILVIGQSNLGASYAYGSCRGARFPFLSVLYTVGTVPPCTYLEVVKSPAALSGTIEGIDCSATKGVADASRAALNPTTDCPCGRVVPVEDTSWGKVKALYQ